MTVYIEHREDCAREMIAAPTVNHISLVWLMIEQQLAAINRPYPSLVVSNIQPQQKFKMTT